MEAIIAQIATEHAREAALLWSLHDADPDEALIARVRLHIVGLRACRQRGVDPLAEFDRPLSGADLLPAACLGPVEAGADDELGRRAIAAAGSFA